MDLVFPGCPLQERQRSRVQDPWVVQATRGCAATELPSMEVSEGPYVPSTLPTRTSLTSPAPMVGACPERTIAVPVVLNASELLVAFGAAAKPCWTRKLGAAAMQIPSYAPSVLELERNGMQSRRSVVLACQADSAQRHQPGATRRQLAARPGFDFGFDYDFARLRFFAFACDRAVAGADAHDGLNFASIFGARKYCSCRVGVAREFRGVLDFD